MAKKLSDRRARHDAFYRKARERGYRARSVSKLEAIDDRFHLISRAARVLDLGCAPGSWLQLARRRGGTAAQLVGVDREPVDGEAMRARIILGDVHEVTVAQVLGELSGFDVVLSDLAPNTSGIRHVDQARSAVLFERALALAEATLVVGGHFVGKLFQGAAFAELLGRCRARFARVNVVKPAGSRAQSIEQYLVARDFRGSAPGAPG